VEKSNCDGDGSAGTQKIILATARRLTLLSAARGVCCQPFGRRVSLFGRTHVGVGFDFASLLFYNTTQLPLHGFECVMDHFFERFVSAVIHLPFIGYKLVARRNRHVDPAPVWIPFVVVVISLLDGYIAAVDMITKSFESCCIIQNEIVDLVRFFQTPIQ
jgi:hypothetical protein